MQFLLMSFSPIFFFVGQHTPSLLALTLEAFALKFYFPFQVEQSLTRSLRVGCKQSEEEMNEGILMKVLRSCKIKC